MNSRLSSELKAEALNLGFFAYGIAYAEAVNDTNASHIRQRIEDGRLADMDCMRNHTDIRLDPRLFVKGAKSIASAAMNYTPVQHIPSDQLQFTAYAYDEDYHDIVKKKLRQLALTFDFKELRTQDEPNKEDNGTYFRVFCDSAPVLECYWATRAGLGWIDRNHQLIIPKAGSMFFLGELFLIIELDYDKPIRSHCGNCHARIDACPTGAITKDGPLDANKCLSYQTIENREDTLRDITEKMGNTVYGCDRYQQACPWNRFSIPNNTPELQLKPEFLSMTRDKWMQLSESEHRQLFRKSAAKRAKYEGLMRNIQAIVNLSKEQKQDH